MTTYRTTNNHHGFQGIVGTSTGLAEALKVVETVAPTTASVLVTGETGTGKELIAQAVHNLSRRADRPFVKVNCASIPKDLFESEFFGHVKGAFTSAIRNRIGRFELADGGTVFLDEVCEIPIELQSKLLRVLQEMEFERVGEETTRRIDVRVVAATNRDPKEEIRQGRFREDLFFRLNVVPIEVPPLRQRADDIVLLAEHFLRIACEEFGRGPFVLDKDDKRALRRYTWPGNVRELRNFIERAVVLSTAQLLDLSQLISESASTDRSPIRAAYLTEAEFRDAERENVTAALEIAGWRVSGDGGAAELLGIPASTLSNRLRSLGISKPSGRDVVYSVEQPQG